MLSLSWPPLGKAKDLTTWIGSNMPLCLGLGMKFEEMKQFSPLVLKT
jgi:hypothetical protein